MLNILFSSLVILGLLLEHNIVLFNGNIIVGQSCKYIYVCLCVKLTLIYDLMSVILSSTTTT